METKKIIEKKINETKSWFFEKINRTEKLLARPTKKKGEKTKITNERAEAADINTKDHESTMNNCTSIHFTV